MTAGFSRHSDIEIKFRQDFSHQSDDLYMDILVHSHRTHQLDTLPTV